MVARLSYLYIGNPIHGETETKPCFCHTITTQYHIGCLSFVVLCCSEDIHKSSRYILRASHICISYIHSDESPIWSCTADTIGCIIRFLPGGQHRINPRNIFFHCDKVLYGLLAIVHWISTMFEKVAGYNTTSKESNKHQLLLWTSGNTYWHFFRRWYKLLGNMGQ